MRTRNDVMAMAETVSSFSHTRRASGRNVKRHLANHRWEVVRVWTLKERIEGRWVSVARETDPAAVAAWIGHERFLR